jgi:carbohydrate-binding DOMON domain-containing protein
MSSDNGVYILQTQGSEYRVTYGQAITNIYGDFNPETNRWDSNPEMMRQYFGESKVFSNLEEAWDMALGIAGQYEWLEDGVCLIREFDHISFPGVEDVDSN